MADTGTKLSCPFDSDVYPHCKPENTRRPSAPQENGNEEESKAAGGEGAALPTIVRETLPTIMHSADTKHEVLKVKDCMGDFLKADLNVSRLNAIHGLMWQCGRPMNARALHRQKMMGRSIVLTQQCDLHLLYVSDTLYLKPLPAYLLSKATWEMYFNRDTDLHKDACGMLLSYIWLLRTPLDFRLAGKDNLLPPRLTWKLWRKIVDEFLEKIDANSLDQVNKRYHFGELRLHRINTVYRTRYLFTHFVRGYLYGYNRYKPFFERSVGPLLVIFVLFSLILNAMQVGVSVPQLQDKQGFNRASHGFVVFTIMLVAVVLASVITLFALVFVYNMFAAIFHARRERKRRKIIAEQRMNGT